MVKLAEKTTDRSLRYLPVGKLPTVQEDFENELRRLDEEFKPWTDAIRESERLTEADLAIYFNAR